MKTKSERSTIKHYLIIMKRLRQSSEGVTTREIADLCGITTRSAQRLLNHVSLFEPIYKEGKYWLLLR